MIDERRRRDEERLRCAQEIADALRDRQAELQHAMREYAVRARTEPVELAAYRRAGRPFAGWPLPDDVC
jgi:hypothetical protein